MPLLSARTVPGLLLRARDRARPAAAAARPELVSRSLAARRILRRRPARLPSHGADHGHLRARRRTGPGARGGPARAVREASTSGGAAAGRAGADGIRAARRGALPPAHADLRATARARADPRRGECPRATPRGV